MCQSSNPSGKIHPSIGLSRPFDVIFYEPYRSEYDAKRREIYLKSTKGRTTLKTMLQTFLRQGDATLP